MIPKRIRNSYLVQLIADNTQSLRLQNAIMIEQEWINKESLF